MRFFRRRNHATDHGLQDARAARARAQAELDRTRAETHRFRALAETLRELRERDPLGVAITSSFRGGGNRDN